MLGGMDSYQFAEWMAFYQLEPFGSPQEDLRAGYLASLTYNANRKQGAKPLKPEDFFPSLKQPEEEMDPEALALALKAMTLALGGTVKNG